jgi:hypothetical protein
MERARSHADKFRQFLLPGASAVAKVGQRLGQSGACFE